MNTIFSIIRVVLIVIAFEALASSASGKPNVLLILADDLGYEDLGFQGTKRIKTPHLDRIAASGVRFGDYHLLRQYPCLDPECGKTERGAICKLHNEYLNDPSRPGFYGAREHYEYTDPGKWSLFDLSNDPHEDVNLADRKPEVVAEMSKQFDRWWEGLTFTDRPEDVELNWIKPRKSNLK